MGAAPATSPDKRVAEFRAIFQRAQQEVSRVIVGHQDVIRKLLTALFCGGHILIEGVPGLGKTLMCKAASEALGLSFKRVQFTPDLMPSDIIGTQVLTENDGRREFQFKPGPLFAHMVLGDEVNRATPKTQSALLEAMEERQVTVFGVTYRLDLPYIVLATQNPHQAGRHLPVTGSADGPLSVQGHQTPPAGGAARDFESHHRRGHQQIATDFRHAGRARCDRSDEESGARSYGGGTARALRDCTHRRLHSQHPRRAS